MRNPHVRFMCYPSVVCAGVETEVTIYPRDLSRRFTEAKSYELAVVGIYEDELHYHNPVPYDQPFTIENGCLKFKYLFATEQEYSIRFRINGAKPENISLYAVNDDLFKLRPLKGDLHTHTYFSDGSDGITMIASNYREEGFDFFALTDHNRMFTSKLAAELYKDVPLGIHIMTGEEVHAPGTAMHLVHVGGEDSVCEKYIHDPETFASEVATIEETITYVPEQYRHRVALAKWACAKIHEGDGIAIFPHPMWRPNRINISKEFSDILFAENMFDALELMGGIRDNLNNLQVSLWQEQIMKGNVLPVVGSSDAHLHDFATSVLGRRFTIVFAKSNTTKDILDAIKNGYSVAGEFSRTDDNIVRFYSTNSRLVMFAHFLFDNYFNETWRLCIGEGILMRRYVDGEPVGDILAALANTVENFYKQYYGQLPAPTITEKCHKFLDKCLEQQRTIGPLTKGTDLKLNDTNARRE